MPALFSRTLACLLLLLSGAAVAHAADGVTPSTSYVTRSEAAMILLSGAGVTAPERRNNGKYPDVIEGEWYVPYLLESFERGILDPPTQGLAYPHKPVTRAEFLKMLSKTFALSATLQNAYRDVKREDWFWPYAGVAAQYQLFTKPSPDMLYPNVLVTHYEISDAVQRVLAEHPNLRSTPTWALSDALQPTTTTSYLTVAGHAAAGATTQYITVAMVKSALMHVLRSNVIIGSQTRAELFDQVNTERARYGLAPLSLHPLLTTAAENHAEDMWKRRYFNHTTPEGLTYIDRIEAVGYLQPTFELCPCKTTCTCSPYFALGENIAQGQLTVDEVMRDWLASPSHRQNILNPSFRNIGIGLFGTIWVQTFGSVDFKVIYR